MEDILWVLTVIVFLVTTNGQCPLEVGNSSIITCERTTTSGPLMYIDFNKINRPCICTVTQLLDGDLLVTAKETGISSCSTQVVVNGSHIFGCPILQGSSIMYRLSLYQSIDIQAEYISTFSTGTFYQCLVFQENGGDRGEVGITCDIPRATTTIKSYTESTSRKTTFPLTSTRKTTSPLTSTRETTSPLTPTRNTTYTLTPTMITSQSSSTTTTTTTIERTTPSSSYKVHSVESTSGFSDNRNTDDDMSFVSTIAVPYFSSIKPTRYDPKEMIYFIAGFAAGGGILLIGLVVLITLKVNRARKRSNKDEHENEHSAQSNEKLDYNNELTENPLYVTSQPEKEVGNTLERKEELGSPEADLKTKLKRNINYDLPPNNKPEDSTSVYAVPNKKNRCSPLINSGDVYAHVHK